MIDTCVWLDCAKDPNQYFLIDTLENLVRDKKIVLLVPRIILEEFNRNQERIAAENSKSIASVVGRLKDSLNRYGDRQQKKKVLQALDNLAHKAPFIDEAATEILERIKNLLLSGQAIETSEKIKLAAANRAIAGKAPFHKQKNSIGDAIIIESYSEVLLKRQPSDRYIFVTHNTRDFSLQSGDTRQPHPDIATLFSKIKFISTSGHRQYFTKESLAIFKKNIGGNANILIYTSFGLKDLKFAENLLIGGEIACLLYE